jgi:hypothetical protein
MNARALLTSNRDFRFIPFGCILLYLATALFFEFFAGSYHPVIKILGIHPLPYFVDLEILLKGIDAIRNHADPYSICILDVACFNYPSAWGLFSVLPFIKEANTLPLGIALIVLVLPAVYRFMGKVSLAGALVYTLFLLSPAVVLGFERGNCDLLLLLLLLVPFLHKRLKPLLPPLMLLASVLKLFPIGAVVSLFAEGPEKNRKSLYTAGALLLAFGVYVVLMKDNLAQVSNNTPRPYQFSSYGLGVLPSTLTGATLAPDALGLGYLGLLLLLFTAFCFYFHSKSRPLLFTSQRNERAYLLGSGIFILTSLIGYNFEYRLIFLLFTLPQLLEWQGQNRLAAVVILGLTLLITWQSFIKVAYKGLGQISGSDLFQTLYTFSNAINAVWVTLLFFFHGAILLFYLKNRWTSLGPKPVLSPPDQQIPV